MFASKDKTIYKVIVNTKCNDAKWIESVSITDAQGYPNGTRKVQIFEKHVKLTNFVSVFP